MKLKAFVSGTTAIFAATMVAYGQSPGQAPATPAGSPTQQERQTPQQRPGQQTPGQQTPQGQQTPGQQTPQARQGAQEQRTIDQLATEYQEWEDADRSTVSLENVPERARNTIQGIVDESQADSADEIVQLEKDNEKVFHAKIPRDDDKTMQVFVQEDGTVVSTIQETDFSAAPQNIRTAAEGELTGESTEPEEFHRVTMRGQSAYVAKVEGEDESKLILINQQGETKELKTKED